MDREFFRAREGLWNMKNEESLLALSIEAMQLDMLMRSNGGNKKYLKAKGIEVIDYRLFSKLKIHKKVLYQKDHFTINHAISKLIPPPTASEVKGLPDHVADDDEEPKIDLINKIKKDMFRKYFSKDDYMNSIEQKIYTERLDGSPKGPSSEPRESLKPQTDPNTAVAESKAQPRPRKCCCSGFLSKLSCKKKKKEAAEVRIEGELEIEKSGLQVKDEEGDQPDLLSRRPEVPEPASVDPPKVKKPSEILLDKFIRKEVPWLSSKIEENRKFRDEKAAKGFVVNKDFIWNHMRDFELHLEMDSNWDGESTVTIQMNQKKLLVIPDFLYRVLEFFKRPFAGSLA